MKTISNKIKQYQSDVILIIGIILITSFAFAVGFLVAKNQQKEPIQFEYNSEQNNLNIE